MEINEAENSESWGEIVGKRNNKKASFKETSRGRIVFFFQGMLLGRSFVLRCGEKSLRRMLSDGRIPYIIIAQRYLIVKEYLINYIASNGCFPEGGDDDA